MESVKKVSIVGLIWKNTFKLLRENPIVFMPFCISGGLKLLSLGGIFFSIFYPLNAICGPIITRLWGEAYLHYPFNFILMPRLFYYKQIALYILVDGLLSAMAVWMVYQANENKKPFLKESFKKVIPRYLTFAALLGVVFLIVYLISYGERFLILKLLRFKFVSIMAKNGTLGIIETLVTFFIIVLVETLFAFAIPFVVIENKKFFGAISGSFSLIKKLFSKSFILILVPTLLSLPFTLLKSGLPVLMDKSVPEITLLILGASVIVAAFVDFVVTTSLTFLFLLRKEV